VSENNIVKRVCKELGVTQKELAEMLDVPQSTLSRWQSGEIPKMAQLALENMLELHDYKTKFKKIKEAQDIINNIQ
jgi:transcriptional regulator with XRE-family HTH domain